MAAAAKDGDTVVSKPIAALESKIHALLLTRCGCQQLIQVPEPGPRTVTVDLVPLRGEKETGKRVFYLSGETATPEGEKVLVYREGPALDHKPLILIPGMTPPKDLIGGRRG